MCRLAAFAATVDGLPELAALIKSLARSAAHDPLLEALGVKNPVHGDGWGFAIAVLKGGAWRVHHMRFGRPIYEDSEGIRGLLKMLSGSEGEVFVGVVHARRASKGEAITWVDAHPHHAIVRDGTEIYVAHNGRVSKSALLGPPRRSDTVALTLFLADNPPLETGLRRVIRAEAVETALTLAILSAGVGGSIKALALNYVSDNVAGEVRREYYRAYVVRAGTYFAAVASSSTAAELKSMTGLEPGALRNGDLASIRATHEGVALEVSNILEEGR